jgi:hypothetical protein
MLGKNLPARSFDDRKTALMCQRIAADVVAVRRDKAKPYAFFSK